MEVAGETPVDIGYIEGYPEPENHIRKAYKRTNIMNVFCT